MTLPRTRAELRAAERIRPLFTAVFWKDMAERVIASAAGGMAAVLALASFNILEAASWEALLVGAVSAALTSLVKGVAASSTGTGSPSVVPSI